MSSFAVASKGVACLQARSNGPGDKASGLVVGEQKVLDSIPTLAIFFSKNGLDKV